MTPEERTRKCQQLLTNINVELEKNPVSMYIPDNKVCDAIAEYYAMPSIIEDKTLSHAEWDLRAMIMHIERRRELVFSDPIVTEAITRRF